ncbi:MAG: murein biosynthesis integral membrane protein MurJ [Candidatus Omnitrophota bacterium]
MSGKIKQIAVGSGLIAVAYFISRFLGLIRDIIIARKFGAGGLTDIYIASFFIPDALSYMLAGGAFSIILIPMLAKHVTETDPPQIDNKGQEIFTAIFTPMTLVILFLTIVGIVLTPWLSAVIFPKFAKNPVQFGQLVQLTRIVLPAQIFFMVGGMINATLRARQDFRGNIWGPNIYNLGIILGGLGLGSVIGIEGLSIGVLIGAFFGPFFICYLMAGKTIRYQLSFNFKSPEFKEYIKLTLPLMIGVSLLTVDQHFIRYFGAKQGIAEGTISCLNFSRTIMLLPIALIGQAAGQVSLTYLSQLWKSENIQEFSSVLSQTMRGVVFLSIVLAGGIFLVAQPLITLIYFGGAFTLEKNHYTAMLLRYIIFAVPPFAALQILMNGYYSRHNTLRPMVVSSICTVFSAYIYYKFCDLWKGPGIAAASLTSFWLIFLVILWDYVHKYGKKEELNLSPLYITAFKSFVAVCFSVIAAVLVFEYPGIIHFNPDRRIGALLQIGASGTVYVVLVFLSLLLMGGDESDILKKLFKKIQRRFLPHL